MKKLGIKPGFSLLMINIPEHYLDLLGGLPEEVHIANEGDHKVDFIHYFETDKALLESRYLTLEEKLNPSGMLWVSWPKTTSNIPTDINREIVRETLLQSKLVDVKVCAIDDDWSGLKFVIRKELR